jgi:hypothetical protein
MANIKFSAFTAGGSGSTSTARVAGFKNLDTTNNYYYTMEDLAKMVVASDSGFEPGSVIFTGASGVLAQDNANFFWDDGNNRLGLGVNTPDNTLEVLSTTAQIKVSYDGSNDTVFAVDSAGDFTITPSGGSSKIVGQGYTSFKDGKTNTLTFNWDEGNIQEVTALATGSPVFTPTNAKAGATYIITLGQIGALTPDWNSLVIWPAGTAPTMTGAGKTDVITLICYDNSSTAGLYYGSATLDFNP